MLLADLVCDDHHPVLRGRDRERELAVGIVGASDEHAEP